MENRDIVVSASRTRETPVEETFVPHNPLNRPQMHYARPIIALLVYIVQLFFLCLGPYGKWWICVLALTGYTLIYVSFIAKRAIIWMVHLYQNLASDETRLKCVFEPSCSEYMILAVKKYGVIRGVRKGINRLKRCGHEHGVDYP